MGFEGFSAYEVYDRLNFNVPVGEEGDSYDRYLVRMAELRESNKLIKQCITWLEVILAL